jgi:hypothetical protein
VDTADTGMPLSNFPQSLGKTSPLLGRTAALFRCWAMCLLLHQRRWWAPARGNEATPTTLSTILSASTAGCLQAGREPLWVCEGAFDALALLAAGVPRVMAIFGVHGWRWDWVRGVRDLIFALDADTTQTPPAQFIGVCSNAKTCEIGENLLSVSDPILRPQERRIHAGALIRPRPLQR